jgi:hypothetical protein
MIVKWFAIIGAATFTSLADILSGPVALVLAIFDKRLSISCWDTSWKWKRAFETLMWASGCLSVIGIFAGQLQ